MRLAISSALPCRAAIPASHRNCSSHKTRGQDQEVEAGDPVGGTALPLGAGFSVKFIDQIGDVEEPPAAAVSDAGSGDADGEVGFAGSRAANQHEVALVVEEVSNGQIADRGFVDLGRLEVELFSRPAVVCLAKHEGAVPWPAAA